MGKIKQYAYAPEGAQSLQHVLGCVSCASMVPGGCLHGAWRVLEGALEGDVLCIVVFRLPMDYELTHQGRRARCERVGKGYAGAQLLQYAVSRIG